MAKKSKSVKNSGCDLGGICAECQECLDKMQHATSTFDGFYMAMFGMQNYLKMKKDDEKFMRKAEEYYANLDKQKSCEK